MVVRSKDRIKIQAKQTNPNDLESADVDSFRQKVLEGQSKRDHAIVTVMAYAGLRISEVLNLYIQDIMFDIGEILVRSGKGDKARTVYLNDKIINAVREYLKERNSESSYMFVSRQGNGKLNRSRINQIFNKYSDIITPHKLRHFYCSQAQNVAGYSIAESAQQAGHASTKTTLKYSHPNRKTMIEKANKL
jgi:integrase